MTVPELKSFQDGKSSARNAGFSRSSRRFRKDRGSVLTEFAILIPIIVMCMGGAIDWALLFYVKHSAQAAVRATARVAAVTPGLSPANGPALDSMIHNRLPSGTLFNNFTMTAFAGPQNRTYGAGATWATEQFFTIELSGNYPFNFLRMFGFMSVPVKVRSDMRYELQS